MPKNLILAILICFCGSLVYAAEAPQLELHPKAHEGYDIKDDRIYFRHGDAGLILEAATPAKIEQYFRDRGSNMGNPFVKFGGDLQNATIFQLTLLNRTNGSLTFTPRYVLVKIKTEAYFPLDYTVLLDKFMGEDKTPTSGP